MRFAIGLISVALFAYLSPMFLPWWGIVLLAAVIGFAVGAKWWQSFLYGLVAVALFQGIYTYSIHSANEGILAGRMSELLNIDGGALLIVISVAIGAVSSALAALAGALMREGILPVSDGKEKRRGGYRASPKRKRRKTWR